MYVYIIVEEKWRIEKQTNICTYDSLSILISYIYIFCYRFEKLVNQTFFHLKSLKFPKELLN